MKRYDNRVLNKLLDSYENSQAYTSEHATCDTWVTEGSQHRRGIFCRIDRKNFPEYYDTTSGEYETIHNQLIELECRGLIKLFWRDGPAGHILEKAALEVCNSEKCYKYIGRTPRWKKEKKIIEISKRYHDIYYEACKEGRSNDSIDILDRFLGWVVNRLTTGKSVKRYVDIDDPSGFDKICRMLTSIICNDRDIYLRQFSIEVFNDSKIAEKELEKSVSIIKEFCAGDDDYSDISEDEILESFGIYRNPVWMYMKGHAVIRSNSENDDHGAIFSLESMENGIGITLRDLRLAEPDPSFPPDCIMTVENLTSYYQQETHVLGMKALIVYIGGFAGKHERSFLMKLKKAYPQARFMHSGDIDCGGFRIWKSLCTGTKISFEPYRMDKDTFRLFAGNGRPLTERDKKDLVIMKDDPFFEKYISLFDLMMETGIKIEQECFV